MLIMKIYVQQMKLLILISIMGILVGSVASVTYPSSASPQDKTFNQPDGIKAVVTNTPNIVLVHGAWADGSSWGKVINVLKNSGLNVLAVQLPLHSLSDDVATVKRAVEHIGGPVILVGHSYGGFVITNAGNNNSNVTGLVYIAAFAPDEGQSILDFVDVTKWPKDFLVADKAGMAYINPTHFLQYFTQDVNKDEGNVMVSAQKPFNQSIFVEKSGSPAWKNLPTWYQISDSDRMIPPDVQRQFARQMNATTISVNASHVSYVSHPDEIAKFIIEATGRK
jgi:pimeloyl-ACP methyl ester carboxylesterase